MVPDDQKLDLVTLLSTTLQMILTGGPAGVLLVNYSTKGIFLAQVSAASPESHFATEYDELMWLAAKQRSVSNERETLRFYELRDRWPQMHLDIPTMGLDI